LGVHGNNLPKRVNKDEFAQDYQNLAWPALEEKYKVTKKTLVRWACVAKVRRGKLNKSEAVLTEEERKVLQILKHGPSSIGELSRRIDKSKESVVKLVDSLRTKHHHVIIDRSTREVRIPHVFTHSFEPTGFNYFRRS